MVDKKVNYLLGKPIAVSSDDETYTATLEKILGSRFDRTLSMIGYDSINCGVGWLYIYYNDAGELSFKRMKSTEIIPGWKDAEHTELEYIIRRYTVKYYDGRTEKGITRVEFYTLNGVDYYEYNVGTLAPVEPFHADYINAGGQAMNWSKMPFIAFKFNGSEKPLIECCKSLQDGINTMASAFANGMLEDPRNTILVLVNYDGEDLAGFRHNLATYGAVKVRSVDGVQGDVKTLQVEVNAENYKSIIKLFKDEMIERCHGFDAKDDRLGGTPNEMNIRSIYSNIDLDANKMELQYQAAFEDLLWFIDMHLINCGMDDFSAIPVKFTFSRSIILNESEMIDNVTKSIGVISTETALAHHPWVDDVHTEMLRLEAQQVREQSLIDVYDRTAFNGSDMDAGTVGDNSNAGHEE